MRNSFEPIWKTINVLIVLAVSLFIFSVHIEAARPLLKEEGRVILIVIDKVGLEELLELEVSFLTRLIEKSTLGLVANRYAKDDRDRGAYVFLTAGVRPTKQTGPDNPLAEILAKAGRRAFFYQEEEIFEGLRWTPFSSVCAKELITKDTGPFDFFMIELSGGARMEEYRGIVAEEQYNAFREEALYQIDSAVAALHRNLNLTPDDLFIVLAPSANRGSKQSSDKPGWLIISRGETGGQVYSHSTKQWGLVSLADIMPTVLNFFNISMPAGLEGRPLAFGDLPVDPQDIIAALHVHSSQYQHRIPYIQGFVGIQVIVIFLTILGLTGRIEPQFLTPLIYSHGLLMLFPLVGLFLSPTLSPGLVLFLTIVLAALAQLLLYLLAKKTTQLLNLILLAVHLGLWLALILRPAYFGRSLLSYSAVIGARFYGLGNEYMGFFIGSGILLLMSIYEKVKKEFIMGPSLALISAGVGWPALGANFGGLLTMLGVSMFLQGKKNLLKKMVLPALLVIILLFLELGSQRTHIGQALANVVQKDGLTTVGQIIKSKIQINKSLWAWTPWTRIFVLFLLGIIMVFCHPDGAGKRLAREMPALWRGIWALSLGSILALFFNDSGVVAGATTLYYPAHAAFFLFLTLKRKEARGLLQADP